MHGYFMANLSNIKKTLAGQTQFNVPFLKVKFLQVKFHKHHRPLFESFIVDSIFLTLTPRFSKHILFLNVFI